MLFSAFKNTTPDFTFYVNPGVVIVKLKDYSSFFSSFSVSAAEVSSAVSSTTGAAAAVAVVSAGVATGSAATVAAVVSAFFARLRRVVFLAAFLPPANAASLKSTS